MMDLHTHVWQYPEHLGQEFAQEVSQACGQSVEANPVLRVPPKLHWQAYADAAVSRAVVLAFRSRYLGIDVPNEYVAGYVNEHPDRLIGFAAVDPADSDPAGELENAVKKLGLKGLKLAPSSQNFHPMDERMQPVYRMAQNLGVPVLFHQATTISRRAPLKLAHPELLEDVALAFPDLRMCVAHMGFPWVTETIALLRKQSNVYADLSGVQARPWELYNTLRLAMEYGVTHKLLFGTDYPFYTVEQTINGLMHVSMISQLSRLPEIPRDKIKEIIHRDSLQALGLQ